MEESSEMPVQESQQKSAENSVAQPCQDASAKSQENAVEETSEKTRQEPGHADDPEELPTAWESRLPEELSEISSEESTNEPSAKSPEYSWVEDPFRILFIATAHNSLSQSLYLALEATGKYIISVEYAISEEVMISAVELFQPALIICPFLTVKVPRQIHDSIMTWIIHPGPPGDAGPSALDWLIIGDEGKDEDSVEQLKKINFDPPERNQKCLVRRWGVSIIQATEEFDAGPLWAKADFRVDIDDPGATKSSLYRGPVTRAAIQATFHALDALLRSHKKSLSPENGTTPRRFGPNLMTRDLDAGNVRHWTDSNNLLRIYGAPTLKRPLLKATEREYDLKRHTAQQVSRRIRSADSQPGAQIKLFGFPIYVYGGIIDDLVGASQNVMQAPPGALFMTRGDAVCFKTVDNRGIWITHTRRVKKKGDSALWPKVPAVSGLLELGIPFLTAEYLEFLRLEFPGAVLDKWAPRKSQTFQEVWIEKDDAYGIAYVYFEFYNGAMSSRQCKLLYEALKDASNMRCSGGYGKGEGRVRAIVLMGGSSYFSNGIALNVIEANSQPADVSWSNINNIDDVVQLILKISTEYGILTVAGVRGSAAAGGVALMAACDYVICGDHVVLNPAYRAMGLYGSEFHTLSYYRRCGTSRARELLHSMVPVTPKMAGGLVNEIMPGPGVSYDMTVRETLMEFDGRLKERVIALVKSNLKVNGLPANQWRRPGRPAFWTGFITKSDIKRAREKELREMREDFFGPRRERFNTRRSDFVRKVKPKKTPLRFAKHRRGLGERDEEETVDFDAPGVNESNQRREREECREAKELWRARSGDVLFPCYYNGSGV